MKALTTLSILVIFAMLVIGLAMSLNAVIDLAADSFASILSAIVKMRG